MPTGERISGWPAEANSRMRLVFNSFLRSPWDCRPRALGVAFPIALSLFVAFVAFCSMPVCGGQVKA